ncbi:hypothetical protein [Pseudomonas petrae]|uniref:Uncharacterized protein n=1 Tax=Pseudomonas petrae TaxID=2912190 RepID=A0ABS9IEX8_9PSED|nr:hypothetical protein [Pseudomonas petrae]MCF7537563.1 hypothetical protein [Pseudomonas petrae]MCF7545631.1 hypothetical protein [Pseudomonas petrae]
MAKTVLTARQDGVQFFMNTESSSPESRSGKRYRLFKTDNFGRDKSGWVQIGSQAGQALIAITTDKERFEACMKAFAGKRAHQYHDRAVIRGTPGKWEGEAFPVRVTHSRDAAVLQKTPNLTRQE